MLLVAQLNNLLCLVLRIVRALTFSAMNLDARNKYKEIFMKYLFILLFSITSNLALASYHGGSENPSSGDDGGGYGGSSSAAGAIVAVGLIAYFVMNSGDDSEEADFINETVERKFSIDFLKQPAQDDFANNQYFEQNNEFQINFKYRLN